jgi:disulfide bond formation protein DsbB
MPAIPPRQIRLAPGLAAAGLVVASLILTTWLDQQARHPCVFQRLLFMVLALLGGLVFFLAGGGQRLARALTLPLSALGLTVASHHVVSDRAARSQAGLLPIADGLTAMAHGHGRS